jgi:hypothetical protein
MRSLAEGLANEKDGFVQREWFAVCEIDVLIPQSLPDEILHLRARTFYSDIFSYFDCFSALKFLKS